MEINARTTSPVKWVVTMDTKNDKPLTSVVDTKLQTMKEF